MTSGSAAAVFLAPISHHDDDVACVCIFETTIIFPPAEWYERTTKLKLATASCKKGINLPFLDYYLGNPQLSASMPDYCPKETRFSHAPWI